MAIDDREFELLSAEIDGETTLADQRELRDRLANDAVLSAALASLREERVARRVTFASLEPTDADADQFASRVIRVARRQSVRARLGRRFGSSAAIAACIAISFAAGWALHRHGGTSTPNNAVARGASTGTGYQVSLTDEQGHVAAVQTFDSPEKADEFARDVQQWQERQRQVQQTGAAVIIADRF